MQSEQVKLEMAPADAIYPKMSIYRSRFNRSASHDEAKQAVARGSDAPSPSQVGSDAARDWTHLRKAKPVNYMLPASMKWLASLPKEVRPWALVRQYPRIANYLALEWGNPGACAAYFDSLLVDRRRVKRQGFPADVHRDLRTLRDYYHRQHLSVAE